LVARGFKPLEAKATLLFFPLFFFLRPEGGRSASIKPRPPSGRGKKRGIVHDQGLEVPGYDRAPSGRRKHACGRHKSLGHLILIKLADAILSRTALQDSDAWNHYREITQTTAHRI
jgi:hypothetical protein